MNKILHGPTIVLYRPMIPPNTGNIARLSTATQSRLLIVGKIGFDLSQKAIRRAGLDYWSQVQLTRYERFKDFYTSEVQNKKARIIAVTKEGKNSLFDFQFEKNDLLVFGNETSGLPPAFLKISDETLRIPMWKNARSLNLSNAAAVVSYFYLEQLANRDEETFAKRNYFLK